MTPSVVCKYRKETPDGKIYCQKHKKIIEQPYKCSKGQCKDCEFPVLAEVMIPVGRCDECPLVEQKRTIGAGYAFDYFCKAKKGNNKIAGYVEYDSEIPPVPNWCPFWKGDKNA